MMLLKILLSLLLPVDSNSALCVKDCMGVTCWPISIRVHNMFLLAPSLPYGTIISQIVFLYESLVTPVVKSESSCCRSTGACILAGGTIWISSAIFCPLNTTEISLITVPAPMCFEHWSMRPIDVIMINFSASWVRDPLFWERLRREGIDNYQSSTFRRRYKLFSLGISSWCANIYHFDVSRSTDLKWWCGKVVLRYERTMNGQAVLKMAAIGIDFGACGPNRPANPQLFGIQILSTVQQS